MASKWGKGTVPRPHGAGGARSKLATSKSSHYPVRPPPDSRTLLSVQKPEVGGRSGPQFPFLYCGAATQIIAFGGFFCSHCDSTGDTFTYGRLCPGSQGAAGGLEPYLQSV